MMARGLFAHMVWGHPARRRGLKDLSLDGVLVPRRIRVVIDGHCASAYAARKMPGTIVVSTELSAIDSEADVLLVSIMIEREGAGIS